MNADGRGEGAAAAPAADSWETWLVVVLLVLAVALLVALAYWLWRNYAASRRDATKGEARKGGRDAQRQRQRQEERRLTEAVGGPGGGVVDVGDAMLCQPPPTPPDHLYENLTKGEALELPELPEYVNVRGFPPWLRLLFSGARRGVEVPRAPPRPTRTENAGKASNPYPQGGNHAGLQQLQGHQLHVGGPTTSGAQLGPIGPTDTSQLFRAEPIATSTPQSSGGSSPESEGLERATRGSRPPAGLSLRSCRQLGRDRDSSHREAARQLGDRENGVSLLPPRGGHHRFTPSWTSKGSRASAEEPEYEEVQAVPMGLVTPIRRESPPRDRQPPAPLLGRPAHWQGPQPARPPLPPDSQPWVRPPAAPKPDSTGPLTPRLQPLQVRAEPGTVAAQAVSHQGAHSSSRGRKPRPLPRSSVRQPQGTAPAPAGPTVQLVADVHAAPPARSLLTKSSESPFFAKNWGLRV